MEHLSKAGGPTCPPIFDSRIVPFLVRTVWGSFTLRDRQSYLIQPRQEASEEGCEYIDVILPRSRVGGDHAWNPSFIGRSTPIETSLWVIVREPDRLQTEACCALDKNWEQKSTYGRQIG